MPSRAIVGTEQRPLFSPLCKEQTPGGTGGVDWGSGVHPLFVGLAGFYACSLEYLGKRAETCES